MDRGGFTLIEIAAVIFIIGLVLSLSFPMIQSFMSDPLKDSSRKLSGAIKNLYFDAVVKQRPFRLNYDLDANIYWKSEVREYFKFGEKEEQEEKDRQKATILPEGIVFEDIKTGIHGKKRDGTLFTTFYAEGWMDPTEIRLKSDERMLSLLPEPATGKVKIEVGYVEKEEGNFNRAEELGIYPD